MKRPVLFVFDLDGTLISSRADLADAVNAALCYLNLPQLPRLVIASYVGDGIDMLLRRSLTKQHLNLFPEVKRIFSEYYDAHLLDHTDFLPEVYQTLLALRSVSTLAVLTNKRETYAKKILEGLGVSSFFLEVAGEKDGRVPKPDPARLMGIIQRSGADAAQTLMVGDGKNDILVAKAVGCGSCVVAVGEKARALSAFAPDFILLSMGKLPALFYENRGNNP